MISGVPYYEETSQEFAEFPDLPEDDPEGDLIEAYAIALLSPNSFKKLISDTNPHLLIKTIYGSLIVAPQMEEGISDRIIVIPLSPFLFMISPPSKKETMQEQDLNTGYMRERFDYQTLQSFKAEIVSTANSLTPYSAVRTRFIQKQIEDQKED